MSARNVDWLRRLSSPGPPRLPKSRSCSRRRLRARAVMDAAPRAASRAWRESEAQMSATISVSLRWGAKSSGSHTVGSNSPGDSSSITGPKLAAPSDSFRWSADQFGEDDHVVGVIAGVLVERAAAGDQPQAGMVDVAVDGVGRELRLRVGLHPVHPEGGDAAVLSEHRDLVPDLEVEDVVEDPRLVGPV